MNEREHTAHGSSCRATGTAPAPRLAAVPAAALLVAPAPRAAAPGKTAGRSQLEAYLDALAEHRQGPLARAAHVAELTARATTLHRRAALYANRYRVRESQLRQLRLLVPFIIPVRSSACGPRPADG